MLPSTPPALFRQKLRLIGNILLFGSLGTASSAILYLIQDQIRQIQRLKHFLDCRKQFAEALRRNGISDTQIQHMRGQSFEQYIQEQEKKGLVRLELVEEPPKWTSSPHKGQMYHVVPVPKNRSKKRSIAPCSTSTSPGTTEGPNEEVSSARVQSRAPTSTWETVWKQVMSKHHSVRRNRSVFAPLRQCRWNLSANPPLMHIQYLHAPARSTRKLACDQPTSSTERVGDVQHTELLLRARGLLDKLTWSSIDDGIAPQMDLVTDTISLFSTTIPGSPEFDSALDLVSEFCASGLEDLEKTLTTLFDQQSYPHVLETFERLHKTLNWDTGTGLVVCQALSFTSRNMMFLNKQRHILRMLLSHLDSPRLKVILEGLAGSAPSNPVFTKDTLHMIIDQFPELLEQYLVSTCLTTSASRLAEECLKYVDGSPKLSDATITNVSKAFIALSLPESRKIQSTLIDLAVRQFRYSLAVQIHQQSPNWVNSDLASGTANLLYLAYTHIPTKQLGLGTMKAALNYFKLSGEPLFLRIVQHFNAGLASLPQNRIELLMAACPVLEPSSAAALLMDESAINMANDFGPILQKLQASVLQRLVDVEMPSSQRLEIFQPFLDWHKQANLDDFEIWRCMLDVTLARNDTAGSSAIAWQMFEKYPGKRPNWRFHVQIMSSLASDGQIDKIREVLRALDSRGDIPNSMESRHMFTQVIHLLAKTADPHLVIDFMTDCWESYGLFLGPRAFDRLVFRSIKECTHDDCIRIIHRLIALSEQAPFNVGVRRTTVYWALEGFRSLGVVPANFYFQMLKKICQTNERLVTKDLATSIIKTLSSSALGRDLDIVATSPQYFGQTWSAEQYRRLVSHRLEAVCTIVRIISNRVCTRRQSESDIISQVFSSEHMPWSEARSRPDRAIHREAFSKVNTEEREVVGAKMLYALAKGYPETALEEFKKAYTGVAGTQIADQHMNLAITALLKLGDATEANQVYRRCVELGIDASQAKYMLLSDELIRGPPLTIWQLKMMVFDWYDTSAMNLPKSTTDMMFHGPLRLAMLHIMQHGEGKVEARASQALDLMFDVYNSKFMGIQAFGTNEYQIFLSAYAQAHSARGIVWVVEKVLQEGLEITPGFIRSLKKAAEFMTQKAQARGDQDRTRQTRVYFSQLLSICLTKQHKEAWKVMSFGRRLFHVLLHDAEHPDVDFLVQRSGWGRHWEALDTQVASTERKGNLALLHEEEPSRLVENARSLEQWLLRAQDDPKHPLSTKRLNEAARDSLTYVSMLANGMPEDKSARDAKEDSYSEESSAEDMTLLIKASGKRLEEARRSVRDQSPQKWT
jgi:tetratricopeptide (TPR) repeat protein